MTDDWVSPGEVEISLPFRPELTQHHGFMAAAALTAIADVACQGRGLNGWEP